MDLEPVIRANWCKFSIGCVKRLDEPLRRRALSGIGEEVRREVRNAGPLEWLPARIFLDIADGLHEALERDESIAYWRRNLRESMEHPFLKPLVTGGLFLFGQSPVGLAKRASHGWQLVTKHCGECVVAVDEDARCIEAWMEGLPAVFDRRRGYVDMLVGGFEAIFDVTGATGGVVEEQQESGSDAVRLTLRWE